MEPVHGVWCSAKTWPTKCPGCGAPVFYFQCDCGSKVFFDALGDPWPVHDCDTSWARNLIRTQNGAGGITVRISEGVTVRRAPVSFSVEPEIIRRAQRPKQKQAQDPIVAVKPEGSSSKVTVVGVLREKEAEADIRKALNLPSASQMAAAFLGPLAKGKLGRVTIHEPSSSNNTLHSYTVWLSSELVGSTKNSKGVTVLAEITPVFVPGFGAVWYCEHYEVLG